MAVFSDLVVNGLLQARTFVGALTKALGINLAGPNVQAATLVTGTQHVTLPEWSSAGGPAAFSLSGAAGATVSGFSSRDLLEYAVLGCLIAIVNIGSELLATAASDPTSPPGFQISAVVSIDPGKALLFIYALVGTDPTVRANYQWVPFYPATS